MVTEHGITGPEDASTRSWTATADFKAATTGPNLAQQSPAVNMRSAFDSVRVNPNTSVAEMGQKMQTQMAPVMDNNQKIELAADAEQTGSSLTCMQPGAGSLLGELCGALNKEVTELREALGGGPKAEASAPVPSPSLDTAGPRTLAFS
ncbi:MAG: hypothetical protein H6853_02025 [Rhodospirillales bacterium]|nr:hypothetical protein [Alphaproteobacteria bacterium]USO04077.1 MAG: hypothetical protein H6853_02025 [Rhodospirillales bacterium]